MNPKSLLNQTIKGHYQLNNILTYSETAFTYEATDLRQHQEIILKYYLTHTAPSINEEIQKAVRLQAQHRSDMSVSVLDFGMHNTQGFWVTQAKQNLPHLYSFLRSDNYMSIDDVIRTVASLCDALSPLHADNKIHGNLKLKNIFINLTRGTCHTKISDFGGKNLCKVHKLKQGRTTYNDPTYFSYEQASGKELTPATDIATLGLIAYILLTHSFPFEGRTTDKILTSVIINSGRIKLKEDAINGSTPLEKRKLCEIINQCLSKNPDQRFSSVQLLKKELLTIQSWAPTILEPPQRNSIFPSDLQTSMAGMTIPFQAINDESMKALMEAQEELQVQQENRKKNIVVDSSQSSSNSSNHQTAAHKPYMSNGPQTLVGISSLGWDTPSDKPNEIKSDFSRPTITPPPPPELYQSISPATLQGLELNPALLQESLSVSMPPQQASLDDSSDGLGFSMEEWQGFNDDMQVSSGLEYEEDTSIVSMNDLLQKHAPNFAQGSEAHGTQSMSNILAALEEDIPSDEELDSLLQAAVQAADSMPNLMGEEQATFITDNFNVNDLFGDHNQAPPVESSLDLLNSLNHYQNPTLTPSTPPNPADYSNGSDSTNPALKSTKLIPVDDSSVDHRSEYIDPPFLSHVDEVQHINYDLDDQAHSLETSNTPYDDSSFSSNQHHISTKLDFIDESKHNDLELFSVPASQFKPERPTGDDDVFEVGHINHTENEMSVPHIAPLTRIDNPDFDPMLDTYVEGFEVANIFPQIPAWQSLVALKDKPDQLAEALLNIQLPLSGHLLPFSQFQLQIEGSQLEENFFTKPQHTLIPEVPKIPQNITSELQSTLDISSTFSSISEDSKPDLSDILKGSKNKSSQHKGVSINLIVLFLLVIGVGVAIGMEAISLQILKEIPYQLGFISQPNTLNTKMNSKNSQSITQGNQNKEQNTQEQNTQEQNTQDKTLPSSKSSIKSGTKASRKDNLNKATTNTPNSQKDPSAKKSTLFLPIPITIISKPPVADIWIKNKKVGKTPLTYAITKDMKVKVMLKGYKTQSRIISREASIKNQYPIFVLQKKSKQIKRRKKRKSSQQGKKVKNPFN
jgi:serine/threonine protein kinase